MFTQLKNRIQFGLLFLDPHLFTPVTTRVKILLKTTATEYNKIVFSWLNTSHRMLHVLRSKNI